MFAVVRTGGKQHIVRPNTVLRVERLNALAGNAFEFTDVLVLQDAEGNLAIGQPNVEGAKVVGTVLGHGKGKKIRIYKYKRRKKYRRTKGHRQWFTEVWVRFIGTGEAPVEIYTPLTEEAVPDDLEPSELEEDEDLEEGEGEESEPGEETEDEGGEEGDEEENSGAGTDDDEEAK